MNGPARWFEQAGDHVTNCRFPAAARTDKRHEAARLRRQRDVFDAV